MATAPSTCLQIVLIKPHKGVTLSKHFDKNVTLHGQFQLYADLLEVENDTTTLVLALAALKDGDIVKLLPDENQHGKNNRFTVVSNVFPSPSDPTQAEQLKITVDENFLRRAMKQSNVNGVNSKINFEALDAINVEFKYCSVDEINSLKLRSKERKELRGQLAQFGIDTPGEIVDFLQDYEQAKKYDDRRAGRKDLQKVTREQVRGRKKPRQQKQEEENEEVSAGQGFFYDLDGRKHFIQDKNKEARKKREERKNSKWWVRLSKPRIRANMDRKEQEGTEDDVEICVEPIVENKSDEII
ncbi:Hypothetical predicted protein [Cloeon dipterum]|uniref:Uncharacterized protein n=1 Tax=Cloeon dipterum TaxID=197152 RepID=A0A8S1CFB7_9INSE|nr:Hypothetical predicted protein [Cloeon dipterum]